MSTSTVERPDALTPSDRARALVASIAPPATTHTGQLHRKRAEDAITSALRQLERALR